MGSKSVRRILIIEDNRGREQLLRNWLSPGFHPVVATSAGKAIGILTRDKGAVYAGVVLDHDLQERCVTEMDSTLSGQNVAQAMIRYLSRAIPVLVHSNNTNQAPILVFRLRQAGFDVTRIPMSALGKELLAEWLQLVAENWESLLVTSEKD
jgi:CheY-like chemotaxis protein